MHLEPHRKRAELLDGALVDAVFMGDPVRLSPQHVEHGYGGIGYRNGRLSQLGIELARCAIACRMAEPLFNVLVAGNFKFAMPTGQAFQRTLGVIGVFLADGDKIVQQFDIE